MPCITFAPDALRHLRLQRGWSPTVLGAAIGKTADAITGYEAGRFAPNAQTMGRLAEALECSVADLFTEPEVTV